MFTLESAIKAIKEDGSEMAFTIIAETNSLILRRQKLVRLAAILSIYSLSFWTCNRILRLYKNAFFCLKTGEA